MDHRRTETFFAIVAPGLEELCARELVELGLMSVQLEAGGVSFTGRLADLYRANLWVRTASRIVVRLASFRSRDFPGLFRQTVRLPWGSFLRPEHSVNLRVTCHQSRLMHSGRVMQTVMDAINRSLGRQSAPEGGFEQLVLVRIVNDEVVISVDSSGELLYRRGYRQSATAAPLRETLAAGCLMLAGWDGTESLFDPMCGSGTILLEGALLAHHRAPGLDRDYAFMSWPGWRGGLWRQLCQQAARQEIATEGLIAGSDRDPAAVVAATANAERARFARLITFSQISLADQPAHTGAGLVFCNPPYGLRLEPGRNIGAFYREMGQDLRRSFANWRCALLTIEAGLAKATGLPFRQIAILDNGGIKVGLFLCDRI